MNPALDLASHPVLGQLVLGYAPIIDRQRQIMAMRLTVFPAQPGQRPDADGLLRLLEAVWPADAGRLSLNLADEGLLSGLLAAELPPHLMLEVPAFLLADADQAERVLQQARRGGTLLLKGASVSPLSADLLGSFAYSVIDVADERRDGRPPPGGQPRHVPHVQDGVQSLAELEAAFARGALAVMGWPVDDLQVPDDAASPVLKTNVAVVIELMTRLDGDEPPQDLEPVIKREPTLAYRLLKYINAPIFGLRMEITSFSHAIMLLGRRRLKRWLALLLVAGHADPARRPLACAAVRRGLLMEALGRDCGLDDATAADLFVCGMFSLLDRLLQMPFGRLLASVPVSPAVREALQDDAGAFAPYLRLARAVEAASVFDTRDAAEALMMSLASVNRALLQALAAARQLD